LYVLPGAGSDIHINLFQYIQISKHSNFETEKGIYPEYDATLCGRKIM
jgi:hypothetical protein